MALDPPQDPSDETTTRLIAALWQRHLPQTVDRLDLLDRAATAATENALTPELRAEAQSIAHKLSGSLGMFGFPEGSSLARELEEHFASPAPNPATVTGLATRLRISLFPIPSKSPLL